jgi:hypothetical protein
LGSYQEGNFGEAFLPFIHEQLGEGRDRYGWYDARQYEEALVDDNNEFPPQAPILRYN